jgi:DNA-binding winged helix-turn-helix (wHTH) protein
VHISKLRKKLGPEDDGRERIKSIRGTGYVYLLPGISKSEDFWRRSNGEEHLQE